MTVGTFQGSPELIISYGELMPGQSITIAISYGNASLGEAITYTPEIFIGVLPESLIKTSTK